MKAPRFDKKQTYYTNGTTLKKRDTPYGGFEYMYVELG